MQVGKHSFTVDQAHARNVPAHALALAPPTAAMELPQARRLADTRASGNGFDRETFTDDFEVHAVIVANAGDAVTLPPAIGLT